MKRTTVTAALTAVLTAAAVPVLAAAPAAADSPVSVCVNTSTGKIVDCDTGKPIKGAAGHIWQDQEVTRINRNAGHTNISVPLPKSYRDKKVTVKWQAGIRGFNMDPTFDQSAIKKKGKFSTTFDRTPAFTVSLPEVDGCWGISFTIRDVKTGKVSYHRLSSGANNLGPAPNGLTSITVTAS